MGRPKKGERVTGPYAVGNRFRLTYTILDKESGEYRTVQETYESESEAQEAKRGFEYSLRKKDSISIEEAIKLYLQGEGPKWKPSSYAVAKKALKRFFPDQTVLLKALLRRSRGEGPAETTYAVQLYQTLANSSIQQKGRSGPLAAATHRGHLKRAKVFIRWCVEQGLLPSNPLVGVKPVGRPNAGKPQLSRDEAKRWTKVAWELAEQGDAAALAALLALLLGVRQSEVTLRLVGDIDNVDGPGAMVLRIPFAKTQKGIRDREIPHLAEAALRRHIAGRAATEWLFPWIDPATGRPRPHRVSWLTDNVARICRLAGVNEVCAHSLRGLHSTLAIKRGMSPHMVADELGHESFATTREHYLAPGTLEAVSQGAVTSFLADPLTEKKLLEQLAKRGLGIDSSGNLIEKGGLRGSERGRKVRKAATKRRKER